MADFTISAAIVPKKEVIVRSALQLSGTIDSTVAYVPDGVINMGVFNITVPNDGITIVGLAQNISGLTSSENNYTMFVDGGGGSNYSGNLFLSRMFITTSGTNSKPADLDNNGNGGAVELVDFSFVSCSEFGEYIAYRQGLTSNFASIGCVSGFTLSGTWAGGFAVLTSIIVSAGVNFTGTFLKEGTSLVINGSIRSDMNALQLHSTGEVCDFQPSNITNDSQFLMNGVRVNPASTAFPNMPASSVKAKFTACSGTENTHIGGIWEISTAATTTIATVDTAVKLAGTTTYSELQHFESDGNNALKYIGTDTVDVSILGVLPLTGTNNKVIEMIVRLWDNSASAYVDISSSGGVTMNAGGRAEGVSFNGVATMDTNDRIEAWVLNQTDSANVTGDLGGNVIVSER